MSGYQEGPDSTFTHNGVEYALDPLLRQMARVKAHPVAVSDLQWVLQHTTVDPRRVFTADLRVPILYTRDPKWGLVVLDGTHRLQKAVNTRQRYLPGKLVPESVLENLQRVSLEGQATRYTTCKITHERAVACLALWGKNEPDSGRPRVYNESQQAQRLYYAALDGDHVVGVCILWNHSRYSPGVWVDPNYRGHGIGRLLLDDLKVDCITVPTASDQARGFVEHLGFKSEGGTAEYQVYTRYLGLYMMAT